jgi:hypothetical protein
VPPLTIYAPPDAGFSPSPTPVALPDPGFIWPADPRDPDPKQPPGLVPKHPAEEVPAPASLPIILTGLGGLACLRARQHWRRGRHRDDCPSSPSKGDASIAASEGPI